MAHCHQKTSSSSQDARDETHENGSSSTSKQESRKKRKRTNTDSNQSDDSGYDQSDASLPDFYKSDFTLPLADIILNGKTKLQNPSENNGVTFALVGSSGCGKSTLIRNVFVDDIYGARRDKDYIVTIFTNSPETDAFQGLPRKVIFCRAGLSQDILQAQLKQNMEFDKRYNFVNLVDDVLELKYSHEIEETFLVRRNSNISSLLSIQWANLIPKSIRTSVYYVAVMKHSNMEGSEVAVTAFLDCYIPGKNIREKTGIFSLWARKHRFYLIDNLNERAYAVTADYMCKELPRITIELLNNTTLTPQNHTQSSDSYHSNTGSSSQSCNTECTQKETPTSAKQSPNTHFFAKNKKRRTNAFD